MGYIYKIENKINGKIYIGETARTPERRWYEHIFYSMAAGSHRHALQNAIRKYGEQNFSFDVLEECPNEELGEREKYYIQKYDSFIKNGKGYNMTFGGDNGVKIDREKVFQLWERGLCCKEIAEQLDSSGATVSGILKENYGITRKQIYERAVKKNRERSGKKVKQYSLDGQLIQEFASIAEIGDRNLSMAISTGYPSHGYFWVAEDSPYPIEQLVSRGRVDSKWKPVAQYTLDGQFIRTYRSIKEAKEITGASKIGMVCNGKRTQSGGYIWKFIEK